MSAKNNVSGKPWAALLLLLAAGCQATAPKPLPAPIRDNVTPLLHHPQFGAAARAAPDFTRSALETVIRLSAEAANHP